MKIYVSDKEKGWDGFSNQKRDHFGLQIISCNEVEIKNLEQHDAEIRKPLEDEIVSLKRYISQLEYWKSYWYNSYDEIRNKYNKNQQEKRTAVKEFIDFAIEKFSEVDDLGDFKYYLDNAEFKYVIKDLLKEKGIE